MSRTSLGRLGLMFVSLLGLMALFSASAFAAGKPIVTASAVSNKTLNTATANGTVNPNGAATTYKIEYGKTALYGSSTTVTSAGNGTSAVAVSAIMPGLEPMTTYHYRISATNSFGTTVSEDVLFEMLLQWKIEGSPISGTVKFQTFSSTPVTLLAEGTIGGVAVKITCENDFHSDKGRGTGVLGVSYHQPFINCKTFLNGKESNPCKPQSTFNFDLNGVSVPLASTVFEFGEECSIGEQISLAGGGFELNAMPEAKFPSVTMTEHLPYFGMTVTVTAPEMYLVDALSVNKKFGIS
jgi:hypothetical protein